MANSKFPVVLFDGVCNVCNGSVKFIIKRDLSARIHFASLQSAYGQNQLKKFGLPQEGFHSMIVIDHDKVYQQSDAVLEIVKHLKKPWSIFFAFKIIPSFIRNGVYQLIAKNRYKFFGRQDQCMIPSPEVKARFVG